MVWAVPIAAKIIGGATAAKAGKKLLSSGSSAPASPTPTEPTIDEAAKNRDALDRLRRRRGVMANIFGGGDSGASSPTVGTKALLGQ